MSVLNGSAVQQYLGFPIVSSVALLIRSDPGKNVLGQSELIRLGVLIPAAT